MRQDDFPEPHTGFVVTHFLVVSDQDRSRDYYQSVFGGFRAIAIAHSVDELLAQSASHRQT
jgi:hypothetical protein